MAEPETHRAQTLRLYMYDYLMKNHCEDVAEIYARELLEMKGKTVEPIERRTANGYLKDLWDWDHRHSSQLHLTIMDFARRPKLPLESSCVTEMNTDTEESENEISDTASSNILK